MDKPYPVELRTAKGGWIAKFETDAGNQFKIWLDNSGYDDDEEQEWSAIFSDESAGMRGIKVTNKGDQFRVFATVMSVIEKFLKKVDPHALTFVAKEESRNKLYSTMIKKYASKLGYELDGTYDVKQGTEYVLARK